MSVEWTPLAEADRRAIFLYIRASNPDAAIALDDRFEEAAERLGRFPRLGRPGRLRGTREFVAHPNYILVYALLNDRPRILRLLHAAQDWPKST